MPEHDERRTSLRTRWATLQRLSWHNRKRYLIHQLFVPKRQVMFSSSGFWFVWTTDSRMPTDPGAYRLWRPWWPLDWWVRLRQGVFAWWNYGTYPKQFADRLRSTEPPQRRLRDYLHEASLSATSEPQS